jgi:hypothetical protein
LEFSHQNAPLLNFQMIGFKKDSVGNLLEQGVIDIALARRLPEASPANPMGTHF